MHRGEATQGAAQRPDDSMEQEVPTPVPGVPWGKADGVDPGDHAEGWYTTPARSKSARRARIREEAQPYGRGPSAGRDDDSQVEEAPVPTEVIDSD